MQGGLHFRKYPSIENADRQKTIDYIRELGLDSGLWQASLKVHGSNFSMITDGKEVEAAKRNGFVEQGENFYNFKPVVDSYHWNARQVFEHLAKMMEKINQVTLFGELFGGIYKHPDVPKHPTATRVQKEVQYCPHNDFYMFDIAVDGFFLPKTEVNIIASMFGFIGSKIMIAGPFDVCLAYPNKFKDPLYKHFNLPEIEGENWCEGIVIEPVVPKFFPNGDRVILKSKNELFKENKSKADHKPSAGMSEACSLEMAEALAYITENRLRNVLSHIGEVTQKDFNVVSTALIKDVIKDYQKDRAEFFNVLSDTDHKLFGKQLNQSCAMLVRHNFRNILDKTF